MSATTCLALVPRDGLFCKDGRGWNTSSSGRGHALDWPHPSTLLGALRTAAGRAIETRTSTVLDADQWRTLTASMCLQRTTALRRPHRAAWSLDHRMWPTPADALYLQGQVEVVRLDPHPPWLPTLGHDDDDARESLWVPRLAEASKPEASPRWWSEDEIVAWATGRSVDARAGALHRQREPVRRVQSHVGIQPDTQTSDDGVLFCHDVIETLDRHAEWSLACEVVGPDVIRDKLATLGSDRRIAHIEAIPDSVFQMPDRLGDAFRAGTKGLRAIIVTPAEFANGWLPDGFAREGLEYVGRLRFVETGGPVHDVLPIDLILRAAFVPRHTAISGWDMAANTPKQTSRMVPRGAVFFFERRDGKPFHLECARSIWLAAIGHRTNEGFGRIVPAIWSPCGL